MGTDIVMVLDRSGSMAGQIDNVIEHFNEYVEEMSLIEDVRLTTVIFDDEINFLYSRIPIAEVPPLTTEVFFARGMTALNDALGKSILDLAAAPDIQQRVIVVVNTDGAENSSSEFSVPQIQELVKDKRDLDWQFVFVGADIDAFGVGTSYGFGGNSTFTTTSNWGGYNASYNTVLAASASYASGTTADVDMSRSGIELDNIDTEIKDTDTLDVKINKRAAMRRKRTKT